MTTGSERSFSVGRPVLLTRPAGWELVGVLVLAFLAAHFLRLSWRKWPDPIVDVGAQWYDVWRVSLGAAPNHDFAWNYGPLSLLCGGLLFKWFGPGMMVLVAANLAVYGAIVALAYLAFRAAWGRLAALAALAVFISVFSFSILNGVGNYNYATPYTNEATHGILLMLATVFVAVRWCGRPSRATAFLLGLCGGVAAVLKPEFMLAGGILGFAAWMVRRRQMQPPRAAEFAFLLAGIALPTLACSVWLARGQSWPSALVDSCQAWWLVLVDRQRGADLIHQPAFTGFDHPWRNAAWELQAAFRAVAVLGIIWASCWLVNRLRSRLLRWIIALTPAAAACAMLIRPIKDWFFQPNLNNAAAIVRSLHIDTYAGACLPGLMCVALAIVLARLRGEWRRNGRAERRTLMMLALVLLAGAMLARMILRARIDHFGFFQAALAGMVAAAVMVSEIPRWTGAGRLGRRLAALQILLVLAAGCFCFTSQSARIRADQTQPVAGGRDLFYAFDPEVDETGLLVNWAVGQLRAIPPRATLQVLPEGVMINYLSRHVRPLPDEYSDEDLYIKQMARTPPDYVILMTRDLREHGILQFGAPGQLGEKIVPWLWQNYVVVASDQGRAKSATLFRRKTVP
jgi:hypothetical protein